jgi:SAM-dependent methyltransferase
MFTKTARYYDAIYEARGKDYEAEADWIRASVEAEFAQRRVSLLDVACGSAQHLERLAPHFDVEGLDVDPAMIEVARERLPQVPFHVARMQDFALERRFDVIICLFSSIGYVKDELELRQTCANVYRHLNAGGIFLLEPWLDSDQFQAGTIHGVFVNRNEVKIARFEITERYGDTSVLRMHYMVAQPSGVDQFEETHAMALFSDQTYRDSLASAGFDVRFERSDIFTRGLYISTRGDG